MGASKKEGSSLFTAAVEISMRSHLKNLWEAEEEEEEGWIEKQQAKKN